MLDRMKKRRGARPPMFSGEPAAPLSEPTEFLVGSNEVSGELPEVTIPPSQSSGGPKRRAARPTPARRQPTDGSILTGLWSALARLWSAMGGRTKLAAVLMGLLGYAVLLNVAGTGLGRVTGFGGPPPLAALSAPADPAKAWAVTNKWQGSGNLDTEAFTVGQSWRVDWIFTPGFGGALQVYIYHADTKTLMNLAVTSQKAGTDTSFWAGAGKYFLRVNSTTGDWKIAVQDQR